MQSRLVFVHALSPLHAGTGQGVGVIDLPIAREKATGLPYLPGSSIKGVLRDACHDKKMRADVFGPDPASDLGFAGSASFSDLRLLLLPVRSVIGTFAWVTSPYILYRFLRDVDCIVMTDVPSEVPEASEHHRCFVSAQGSSIVENGKVLLEELDLDAEASKCVGEMAEWIGKRVFPGESEWQRMLVQRLCIVSDDVLSFLLDTATEIFSRIRMQEDAKTVAKGGLWYEEALPAETILSGIIVASPVKATPDQVFATIEHLTRKPLQLGGKASVGRGLCRVTVVGGN
ncbi:MAG: type III-B CRISPR module RAMP protein Cmr4 [Limnochordia bacterium]|jgi:CRISPR-associated protein Cmr4